MASSCQEASHTAKHASRCPTKYTPWFGQHRRDLEQQRPVVGWGRLVMNGMGVEWVNEGVYERGAKVCRLQFKQPTHPAPARPVHAFQ